MGLSPLSTAKAVPKRCRRCLVLFFITLFVSVGTLIKIGDDNLMLLVQTLTDLLLSQVGGQ